MGNEVSPAQRRPPTHPHHRPNVVRPRQNSYQHPIPSPSQPPPPVKQNHTSYISHNQQPVSNVLTKSYNFGDLNITNVNDKINEFKKYQEQQRQEFEREYSNREDLFNKALNLFENSAYDPYKVLGLDKKNIDMASIKKAYKILAMRHHPDKGGDEEKFKIITQAYVYLMAKYNQDVEQSRKMTQTVSKQEYREIEGVQGMENIHLDKEKFNINKFNEIFDKYKIIDDDEQGGYGEIMDKSPRKDDSVAVSNIFNNKSFNIDIFNSTFNEQASGGGEIMEYKEPSALFSGSNMAIKELGKTNVDDFSGNTSNLNYTDYKSAYSTQFIQPDKVKYKQYKNINDLKSDRDSISYQMSNEDKMRIEQQRLYEDEQERQRLEIIRQRDEQYRHNFDNLNRMRIGGGKKKND
jgi:curved DNA-binding protein CbpA